MYTVSHSQWCAILCQSPINNSGKMTVKSRHIQKTSAIPRVYRWTIQVPERRAPIYGNFIIYDTCMLCFYYHIYSEMFEASRWHSYERFFAPMITHKNGDHIFVGDTVNFQDPADGPCSGIVVKFMTEVASHFY